MNSKASAGTALVLRNTAGPAAKPNPETALGDAAGDWVCAWCLMDADSPLAVVAQAN